MNLAEIPKKMTAAQSQPIKSTDLFIKLNQFRVVAGQNHIRYNDFMIRIADELDSADYETFVVQNSNKTETKVAYLDNDQCLLVGMRESKAVRKKVLAWIKSLEKNQTAQPEWVKNLSPQAVIAIEDMNKQIEVLADKVAEDAPKVEFVETYVEFGQTKCFRDVAAILGVKQTYFTNVLKASKIVYKKAGVYKAYADYAKYFEVRVGSNTYTDKITGLSVTRDYEQLRVNNAGIVYLAKRFGNPELKDAALAIAKGA